MQSPRPKRLCSVVSTLTKSLGRPLKSPYFGQSRVTLSDDKDIVASWPGPVRDPDSSAPQPPGARPAGSVEFRVRFNPQNAFRAGPPALFFSARPLRDAREHGVCLWNSNRRNAASGTTAVIANSPQRRRASGRACRRAPTAPAPRCDRCRSHPCGHPTAAPRRSAPCRSIRRASPSAAPRRNR